MKNNKLLIISIILVIIIGTSVFIFTDSKKQIEAKEPKKEEKKKLSIEKHKEKFEKILESDYKMDGYVFEYDSTDEAFIIYNRIKIETGEIVQQLAYEILTSNISIIVATDKMNTFTE